MPTYNFLLLELIYEYKNRKNSALSVLIFVFS